jgi:hypothetical protein
MSQKRAEDLTREQLLWLVNHIQAALFIDFSPDTKEECPKGVAPSSEYWNPDKEWDSDTLDHVASVLDEHGLAPRKPSPA